MGNPKNVPAWLKQKGPAGFKGEGVESRELGNPKLGPRDEPTVGLGIGESQTGAHG